MSATVRPLPTVAALTAEVERLAQQVEDLRTQQMMVGMALDAAERLHERVQEELHRPGVWRWWRVAALRRRLAGIAGSMGDALADARRWA